MEFHHDVKFIYIYFTLHWAEITPRTMIDMHFDIALIAFGHFDIP